MLTWAMRTSWQPCRALAVQGLHPKLLRLLSSVQHLVGALGKALGYWDIVSASFGGTGWGLMCGVFCVVEESLCGCCSEAKACKHIVFKQCIKGQ
jgi:hypothetical protein